MGRFALLAGMVVVGPLALAPGAGGGDPAAPDDRLVLAVIGDERSASAVHGERAVVADPSTGELGSFVLPGGTLCHGPLMVVGGRVVFSGYRGSKAVAMSLPLTLSGEPESLGRADTVTPSPRPGRVWLGRWRHGEQRSRAAFREVAVPGEAAASRARGARPVASGGSRFAWCRGQCRTVRVRSPGGERMLGSPVHLRPQPGGGGAFSPDGSLLALPVTHGGRSHAAVVDLRTRAWTAVPGGRLSTYGALAWSPSGRRLYLASPAGRLRAWQPGAPRAHLLPVDPGGTVMSIAVTEG